MSGLIDLRTWKRREHYLWFRRYAQPFFSVTVDVDVTSAWRASRKRGAPSFFLSSVYRMLKAANDVEAFRLRLRPRGVWKHDRVAVGPTIMRPHDTFAFVRLEPADTLDGFAAAAEAAIARAVTGKGLAAAGHVSDDIVFHSVLPWLRFTSFTNALPGKSDSVPRIVFGRCSRQGGRMTMPISIEVHHALVDGLDVARFVERFSNYLERG